MESKLEVIKTDFSCDGDEHRLFALEMVGQEDKAKVTVCLACTSCGTLIVHRIQL